MTRNYSVVLMPGPAPRAPDSRLPRAGLPGSAEMAGVPIQDRFEALDQTRFNRTAAAKLLGITFRALRYRMERLGIHALPGQVKKAYRW